MNDLVSVYIPTKNRLTLLKRAVYSVLGQTARNIELIVVSDGSNDGSCEFVNSIVSDITVRLIHNEQSVGACVARNQALEIATGNFVTGLDDDDFFMPHRIERFLEHWAMLESQQAKFSCLFDSRIVDTGDRVFVESTKDTVTAKEILGLNPIGNQVFTRKDRIKAIGSYDAKMPAWQDWELWVRLLAEFGDARNMHRKSYYSDMSHEFERISMKSGDKIRAAAQTFYTKHGADHHRLGLLRALGSYPQIGFTLNDLWVLFKGKEYRKVAGQLVRRKYVNSFESTLV